MATVQSATSDTQFHTLNVVQLLVTGGLTAAIVFLLCWLGAFLPFSSPTHAYIGLFTTAPVDSLEALFTGLCWSLLFGGLVGAVFAILYNLTSALERG